MARGRWRGKERKRGGKKKKEKRVRENTTQRERRERKPICALENHYSLDFPQLLMA